MLRYTAFLRAACSVARRRSAAVTCDRAFEGALTEDAKAQPTLRVVPKLPLAGSLWQRYSDLPVPYSDSAILHFYPAMRKKYGDFYEFGLPGVGAGVSGKCYVINDPWEMAAILQQEGEYPRGVAEFSWAFRKYFTDHKIGGGGTFKNGPEWQRNRRFIQSDLLSPTSAARHVPAILEAAQVASRGAPHFSDRLNEYLNLASFDMFSNVMLGHVPKVSDPSSDRDPKDVEFCSHIAEALRMNIAFMRDIPQTLLNEGLGLRTKKYKEFERHFEAAYDHSKVKVRDLQQRRLDGTLSCKEKDCYVVAAYERQASQKDDLKDKIQVEEVEGVVCGLMATGVDTTGGMLSFKLLHLAANPHIQEKLHAALLPTLDNGRLTRESLAVPYLSQFLRESHRVAPAIPPVPIKTLTIDTEVHGRLLPKGSIVMLETHSTGQLQEHFDDDVREIVPERFSKEAIKARKGTPHQIVDHSFSSGPFSQGARKCPGSRLANLEASAIVAQWVLDWRMEMPADVHFSEVPYRLESVITAKLPSIQFTPR